MVGRETFASSGSQGGISGLVRSSLTRRRFLQGLGAAALVPAIGLPLAGCGGGGGSGSGGGGKPGGSVTFVYYGNAADQKAYDALFTQFRADHPEITLKAQGIAAKSWADFANSVATRLAGGQPLDVVQIATEGQRIFMTKDLLEPLDDYIKKDQAAVDEYYKDTPEQIRKFLQQHASQDGHTFFMPGGYNTMALYLNNKIFSAAGVEPPTDTWTWDDFQAAGQTIQAKTGAFLTACGSGYFTDVMPWMLNNGAAPISDDWTQSTIDTPEAVEALTFARSLVVAGLAPKPGGTFDAPTQMAQGKLATFGGGRWPTNDLRRLKFVDSTQLVKWPMKAKAGSPVGWDAWPILKGSKNKDAALGTDHVPDLEDVRRCHHHRRRRRRSRPHLQCHRSGFPQGRTEEHRAPGQAARRRHTDPRAEPWR